MLAIITIIAMALLAIGFASFLLYDVFLIVQISKMIIISKIQEIKSTGVVSIKFLPDGLYLDFDSDKFIYLTDSKLDPFAILTKNRPQSKTYKLTIPYLEYNEYTQSVQLHYYSTIYTLNDNEDVSNIKSVIKPGVKNNYKLITVQQLAPIINEHLQIKAEIKKLRQRYVKISNLAKLVAASDI